MDLTQNKIRLNSDEIKFIAFFESLSKAAVRDCIQGEDFIGFVVEEGDMGLAIGKKGVNVERVKRGVGKDVFVVEYSNTPEGFIRNMFHPADIKGVILKSGESKTATIEVEARDRGKVIGPSGRRIKLAKKLLKRYWDIDNLTLKEVA